MARGREIPTISSRQIDKDRPNINPHRNSTCRASNRCARSPEALNLLNLLNLHVASDRRRPSLAMAISICKLADV
jgi:hypothetical protein